MYLLPSDVFIFVRHFFGHNVFEYRIHDGIELLKKAGIEVEQIEDALDYKKK